MMIHLTRFAVLLPVRNKTAETVANAIIERIISIFCPPETLHSDQGPELENKVIYQLQQMLGYKRPAQRRTGRRVIQCPNGCTQRCTAY